MSDIHYYLDGWKPANRKPTDQYSCVGGNFHPLPGYYKLPFNEGMVFIDGKGHVCMKPRGTDDWYRHPLMLLGNLNKSIDFGWYSIVRSEGNPEDFSIFRNEGTGFTTMHSIQSTWIRRQMEPLANMQTAKEVLLNLCTPYTEDDAVAF